VIAIGRYMLAALIMFAMIVDASPILNPSSTAFAIIGAYLVFALAMVAVTWNDWWLDARLAGPAHAVDIITYTFLIFLMGADDSPTSPSSYSSCWRRRSAGAGGQPA
jgi:hypothetical protein